MSTIRSMTNEDLLQYRRLCSICYTYRDTEPVEELDAEQLRIRMGVFGRDGQLLSAMMQIPYEVRFCGESVKLLGVGGVVTDPAARGERGIRRLFEEGLPRLYSEGHVFSALYPFSHRFYAKFGYTWVEYGRNVTIPTASVRKDLVRADEIVRVLPGEDDQGMAAIYAEYAMDKHLALVRDSMIWKELRRGTPWEHLKHAYVLKAGGRPVAYWIGTMAKEGYEGILTVKDMAWTCPQGRDAIFAMLRGMNEVTQVKLRAWPGFEPRCLVEEPYDVADHGPATGMFRVVNVERALALLPAPVLPGSFTLKVEDDQIPANCRCFTVSGDGYSLVVTRDDKVSPDGVCTIGGLSALVAGRHTFEDALRYGVLELSAGRRTRFASMLFAKRELHLNHDF